ncbi:tRNA lysidine(34) synthetase TilS [Psychroserpens mesophilus]|uniref:tRNA lysidine(34) synthetase TilS n=1 Tax=Psychroserpens mesophilus TaxID=325473 RepID=UPI003F4937FE
MIEAFHNHIKSNLKFLENSKLLIAVSGGLDSVVLTQLCHELKLNFALAHCNFKLRGKESDADENFVLELGDTLDLEVFVEYFDTETFAEIEKLSIQMAARELRYQWFFDLAKNLNFDYVLTAHHADDNLETFLINLSRGTGLNGLTGIPEINDNIVRPLLPFSREQLEKYAKSNGLNWREDSSNISDKYLRNKLRHHVIPAFKAANPDLLQNFKKTLEHLNDTSDIVEESLNAVAKRAIESIDEHHIGFKISEFKKVNNPKAYLFEMFKAYGFTEWNDVVGLLDAQSGKQVLSKTHRLIKDRTHLILTDLGHHERNRSVSEESILINESDIKVKTPIGTLFFDEAEGVSKPSKMSIYVDKNQLVFPLQLRRWKDGDLFHPSGMTGKKKLSKYFKDEKLSIVDKENIWLLTSNDKIVWVIGMRADERFKVTESTTHMLRIKLN